MDRNTARVALLAVVGVLAIALAASTLTSTIPGGSGSGIAGEGDQGVIGGEQGGVVTPAQGGQPLTFPDWLAQAVRAIVLVVFALVLLYMLIVRTRETLALLAVLVVATVAALLLFTLLGMLSAPSSVRVTNGTPLVGSSGGEGETALPQPLSPPLLFLLIVLLGGFVLAMVISRNAGVWPTPEDPDDSPAPTPEATAVGRAAGRAADRIEGEAADEAVDNEVYRAWRDMTALLEVDDPETSTPGEFATAAVEAGLNPDDVRELTRLFEDVRYGGTEPTEASENRAVSVFRRIESAYAGEAE